MESEFIMELKSNEEITKAFDKEEQKLTLLQYDITEATRKLRQLQKLHRKLTGKTFYC